MGDFRAFLKVENSIIFEKKSMRRIGGLWVLIFCIQSAVAQNKAGVKPNLVVGICIDQLRWDYLERFKNDFGKSGFNRLRKEGFSFENTLINYAFTATAAGHASIYTGSVPALHGIVGNDWREGLLGMSRNAVQDSNYQTVGSNSSKGMVSPGQLLATTVGDELRLSNNFRSRVFSVALKDRSAVIPGGRSCNAAYWFDESAGDWISSSYYLKALPEWVQQINQKKWPDGLMGQPWELSKPILEYIQSSEDSVSWERIMPGETKSFFPHNFDGTTKQPYLPLCYMPAGNQLSFDFCKELIENEQLGKNGLTDMLCLSLSSLDFIGHEAGPNSVEVEDMMIKLDQQLAAFLQYLDNNIGMGKYLLFLTADHGVAHVPGYLKAHQAKSGVLKFSELKKQLNDSSKKYFGVEVVQSIQNYQVYLNKEALRNSGLSFDMITDRLSNWIKENPDVAYVFPLKNLYLQTLPRWMQDLFANGHFPGRSGDIQLVLTPQVQYTKWEGADHGSIYQYDRHIPLIWFGSGISKGRSFRASSITDIAPTLAALLGIQMPNAAVGQVLEEVVK